MQVNQQKTALLCISAATSFKASAVLRGRGGEEIHSAERVKILGFMIDADGGYSSHVDGVVRSLRSKTWALLRLKRHGFNTDELVRIYTTNIRPAAEYVCVVWHSGLSAQQSEAIERQQTQALRHIYGFGPSARKMRKMAGVETLFTRRERACKKFALKASVNKRFEHWFPERDRNRYDIRRNWKKYAEPICRTDRHRNSR